MIVRLYVGLIENGDFRGFWKPSGLDIKRPLGRFWLVGNILSKLHFGNSEIVREIIF